MKQRRLLEVLCYNCSLRYSNAKIHGNDTNIMKLFLVTMRKAVKGNKKGRPRRHFRIRLSRQMNSVTHEYSPMLKRQMLLILIVVVIPIPVMFPIAVLIPIAVMFPIAVVIPIAVTIPVPVIASPTVAATALISSTAVMPI